MDLQEVSGRGHAPPPSQPREPHAASMRASVPSGWPTTEASDSRDAPRQCVVERDQAEDHPLLLLHRIVPHTPVADAVRALLDSLTSYDMRGARSSALNLDNSSSASTSTSVPSDTHNKAARLHGRQIVRQEDGTDSLSSLPPASVQRAGRSPTRGRTDTVNSLPR